MKLAICCNHSFPQCGGSEIVISKIAEFLIGQGNYNVSIFSTNVKKIFTHRGVRYEPLARNFPTFAKQINNGNFDRMFVYSDYFIYWSHMVMNPKVFSCKISIALVGMNQMLLKRHILAAFRKNSEKFQTITHSDDYQDFKECQRIQVPVHVVPNGVDLDEFDHAEYIPFEKEIIGARILCVANFFPGKGHEYFPQILSSLREKYDKPFSLIVAATTVNIPNADQLEQRFKNSMDQAKLPCKIYKDLDRPTVVGLFKKADVFAFPSQKEVAPLVVMESMAAKTPWVAMPVGNVTGLPGGIVIPHYSKDKYSNIRFNDLAYGKFADSLAKLLSDEELRKKLGQEGYDYVRENHDWSVICKEYERLFEQ